MRNQSKFIDSLINPWEVSARTKKVNRVVETIDGMRGLVGLEIHDMAVANDLPDETWALLEQIANVRPLSDASRRAVASKLVLL